MDYKGPVGGEYYFHLVYDAYSRFVDIEVMNSTKGIELHPTLDKVWATHGYCHTLVSDNGPPYNSHEFKRYCRKRDIRHRPATQLHPQGNAMAERMVKKIVKMIHTAILEDKDPRREVYMMAMTHNNTPHSVTGKAPAEILMERTQKTNLPALKPKPYREDKAVRERDKASKVKNKIDFDKRKRAKDKKIAVGDQVMVARPKTTTKTPWDPNPYKVVELHYRRATLQRGRSNLQRDTGDVKKLKSRPLHLQHQRETKQPKVRREEELDYDISIPATQPPPPQNPFIQHPVADIQPAVGRLARRERWLLAPLADMFLEPPGLQQTRSGRTINPPDRWVMSMFRQEGGKQVEDSTWYQQNQTWEADKVPSDIETGGRESRPPTADSTPVQSEEDNSGDERWVRDMVEEARQRDGRSRMEGLLPQQMAQVELTDPTWLGQDEPHLLYMTPIPHTARHQLSPKAQKRNQSRAKFRK